MLFFKCDMLCVPEPIVQGEINPFLHPAYPLLIPFLMREYVPSVFLIICHFSHQPFLHHVDHYQCLDWWRNHVYVIPLLFHVFLSFVRQISFR